MVPGDPALTLTECKQAIQNHLYKLGVMHFKWSKFYTDENVSI